MITTVNPGLYVRLEGDFELGASLVEVEQHVAASYEELRNEVRDRESRKLVTLADLLRSFIDDPTVRATGLVEIIVRRA